MRISVVFGISLFILFSVKCHMTDEEIVSAVDQKTITCGSVLRIQNVMTKYQ